MQRVKDVTHGPGRFPVKIKKMKNFELSDSEILAIFNKALNATAIEEKENRRCARIRVAKADFCNLDATDYCKFVSAE